jgi:hypothetical protein
MTGKGDSFAFTQTGTEIDLTGPPKSAQPVAMESLSPGFFIGR